MPTPETLHVKARVAVAGLKLGEIAELRAGYARTLIKAGYVEPVNSLNDVMLANPVLYGEWEIDPRSSEET